MAFNPVKLELVKNAICSTADEMLLTVVRIAYSSIVKDVMDMSSAICDRRGRLIAQGLSLPLHLGSIPDAMEAVLEEYPEGLAPGDVAVLNDPYQGGMHLPDIFMFRPVHVGERLLGYAVMVVHQNDIGGRVPGSSAADSKEIYAEGLRIPVMKLYDRDVPNKTLFKMIEKNVRKSEIVLGDIDAQLASCRIGERGLLDLVKRYPVDELEQYFDALLDYSERGARRTISGIPDGTYQFSDFLDDDGIDMDVPVPVKVTLHVKGDELTVDLTGSAPQVQGAINSTVSFIKSSIYFAIRSVMDSDVPNNAGFFRPIHVVAPEGTIVNVSFPGACAARGVTGFRVIDALFGALAQAIPERVRAAGEGGSASYSFGGYAGGKYFLFREAIVGCWGAGDRSDGIDGVTNPAINVSNAPIEVVEYQNPIQIERYELVPDSGGAGRRRGGLAVRRQVRFLGETATLQLRSDRRAHPPYGLDGANAGSPSETVIHDGNGWTLMPTKITTPMKHGWVMRHTCAGAGGFGDPLEREPAEVLDDVRNGKVSRKSALDNYAVCLLDAPLRVDLAATAQARAARRNVVVHA